MLSVPAHQRIGASIAMKLIMTPGGTWLHQYDA